MKTVRAPRRPRAAPALVLRLFVAGASPNSLAAIANLKAIESSEPRAFDVEIVDVLKSPERALAESILVTPTLVKVAPAPACRILGNLRDLELVLRSLGLR
jgi:circadian clock protein KaiB